MSDQMLHKTLVSRRVKGQAIVAGLLFIGAALVGCGDSGGPAAPPAASGATTQAPIKGGAGGGAGKGMSPKDLSIPAGAGQATFGDKAKSGG